MHYFTLFRSLSTNPKVKELLKSVHICQSYRKNKSGTFLMTYGVVSEIIIVYYDETLFWISADTNRVDLE